MDLNRGHVGHKSNRRRVKFEGRRGVGGNQLTLPHWGSQVYTLISVCVKIMWQREFLLQEVRGKRLAKVSFKCHNRPDFWDMHASWGENSPMSEYILKT
jgi:hypothetical protein